MPDVIHDPGTDWCACEPLSDNRCGYRLIEKFNPRDDDASEVGICILRVLADADYIASLPCRCPVDAAAPDYAPPCQRCEVLGRRADKPEER